MVNSLSILGSTGSIGTQTLDVADKLNLKVSALTASTNIKLLEEQVRKYKPELAVVFNEEKAKEFKDNIKDTNTRVLSGMDGLIEAATLENADLVVNSVVGMVGLKPTLAAANAKKDIAFANKETLVTGGKLVCDAVKKNGVKLLPVDSEHSAIFQCLQGMPEKKMLKKLILTASGGPFFGKTVEDLKNVTVNEALNHPNWSMGAKITIDSATMVNKGLEVIEAKWLFGVGLDDVQVVVQPQSLIHSMVQFKDGAIMAQLGTPDMRLPIQYALYYPERRFLAGERVDFGKIAQITFEDPDPENFRGLALAYQAATVGGSMPTVFNAANEKAVAKFLNRKIGFLDITDIIEYCMSMHKAIPNPTVEQILDIEQWTYELIESRW